MTSTPPASGLSVERILPLDEYGLAPCPFCGTPWSDGGCYPITRNEDWWRVACGNVEGCGASIERETREATIAAWNRRALLDAWLGEADDNGWQPISTAPRDGSYIWVACEHCMRIACWSEDRWRDLDGKYPRLDVLFTPTHWRRIPPLPTPTEPGAV